MNAPTAVQRTGSREAEPGYVLHSYPFKETSLVVEVFTRDCGRLGLVAKGARRPRSLLRGSLMAFQPLLLSWSGKSELRVLHTAEWAGGQPQLSGLALICGLTFAPEQSGEVSMCEQKQITGTCLSVLAGIVA